MEHRRKDLFKHHHIQCGLSWDWLKALVVENRRVHDHYKKVKLSLCFFFKLSTAPWRRFGGVEVYLHGFFDLGTRWRWVISFTPRPLYLQWKSPWYSLDRRLGGPQSRFGRGDEEKNSQPLRESKPGTPIFQPVAYTILIYVFVAQFLVFVKSEKFVPYFVSEYYKWATLRWCGSLLQIVTHWALWYGKLITPCLLNQHCSSILKMTSSDFTFRLFICSHMTVIS
jgi:hypothetical protein